MISRRNFIFGGSALVLPSSSFMVQAQDILDIEVEGELPPLPNDLVEFANEPPAPYTQLTAMGTGEPNEDEINEAVAILIESPHNKSPIEVAE